MLCGCAYCLAAKVDAGRRRTASSLFVEHNGRTIILDPSPDIHQQWHTLAAPSLDAVAVTHAHAGHYLGLGRLGKEGPNRAIPLHASQAMCAWLDAHAPWSALPLRKQPFAPGEDFNVGELRIETRPLVHRAEHSDTVAFLVHGDRRVLYLPDTDAWDAPALACLDALAPGDAAFVDATFWSAAEVQHRDVKQIPHPFVADSLDTLGAHAERGVEVFLTHLNHTNPLNDPDSSESAAVRARGLQVAKDGMRWPDNVL